MDKCEWLGSIHGLTSWWVTTWQHILDFSSVYIWYRSMLLCSIGAYCWALKLWLLVMQFGQKFSQPPAEDIFYSKTRSMLHNLGLQNYEKNFKKGLLTDTTLPLLTDRLVFGFWSSYSYSLLYFYHLSCSLHIGNVFILESPWLVMMRFQCS